MASFRRNSQDSSIDTFKAIRKSLKMDTNGTKMRKNSRKNGKKGTIKSNRKFYGNALLNLVEIKFLEKIKE